MVRVSQNDHDMLQISIRREMDGMSDKNRHPFHAMALMSGILSQLVGSTLLGIFGGMFLDDKLETPPLFLIIGLLLGLAAGVFSMIKLINRYFGDDRK
jgi:ATP synthase protein I